MSKTHLKGSISAAARLLKQVADGSIPPDEALKKWPLPLHGVDRLFVDGWTHLQYFSDDADIRSADRDYADAQIAQLRELAARIDLMSERS